MVESVKDFNAWDLFDSGILRFSNGFAENSLGNINELTQLDIYYKNREELFILKEKSLNFTINLFFLAVPIFK